MIPEMISGKGIATMLGKFGLPAITPLIAQAAGLINEQTVVPLTVVSAIGGACWYLNGRLTRIEDKIENMENKFKDRNTYE